MLKLCFLLVPVFILVSCNPGNKPASDINSKASVFLSFNKGNQPYGSYFASNTMRLDYFHSGTAKEDHFAIDQVVSDRDWPGSINSLIDKLELGAYFFEVIDQKTRVLLYSRGFSSVFGEWQTTPAADSLWGTFHESLRFPWPLKPVTVILKKRDAENKFQPVWSTDIDPASRQVTNAVNPEAGKVDVIMENGPAQQKVDLVILGDGYSKTEMEKFRNDAKRLTNALFNAEPFKSRKADFNEIGRAHV